MTRDVGAPSPAAAHTARLLTLLATHGEPQPAAALSRELGLPRATTYRLLATLVQHGYVAHLAETRRYGLGVAAYELAWAYQRQAPLQRVARPVLSRLVEVTTHNAHLAVLHGKDVVYVVEERAPRRPSLVSDVGVRLPAELTASGLAMLALLPSAQVSALYPDRSALVRRNGNGPATVTQLRSLLTRARRQGHSEEVDSITVGLSSVAMAVIDHNGRPVAAVASTFPTHGLDEAARALLIEQVRRAAAAISARLGGPAPSRSDQAGPAPS